MCSVSAGSRRNLNGGPKNACVDCGNECFGVRCRKCYRPYNAGKFTVKQCRLCRGSFIAKQSRKVFCSTECLSQAKAVPERTCVECGKGFTPDRKTPRPGRNELFLYCGRKCSAVARVRRKSLECRLAVSCDRCGKEFLLLKREASKKQKLCSRECIERDRHERKNIRDAEKAARLVGVVCADCGVQLKLPGSLRCRKCSAAKRVADCSCNKRCSRCGDQYVSKSPANGGMCERCVKRSRKNKSKHLARCKKRGLPFDCSVNLREVSRRCAGKCFWCGQKTLKKYVHKETLFGVEVSPFSPTIDHVVPLLHDRNERHGHTKTNAVLCCHECNTAKNDSIPYEGIEASDDPVQFAKEKMLAGINPSFAYPKKGGEIAPFVLKGK